MLAALCGVATTVFLTLGVSFSLLPEIAAAPQADQAQVQWIGNVHPLVVASTLLPAGILSDRFGRKRALVAAPPCWLSGCS